MKALILIVVLLATGAESQATWKQRRLTSEEEQRCYADARTAVLQIAELRLRIEQQENTQNSAASQIGQLKDDLALQTQLTASLKEEVNQLKQQISRLQSASVGQIEGEDCKDLLNKGLSRNGVYNITSPAGGAMQVYCDMETDGGGWVVFQRRMDGSQNFLLGWEEYASGFGDLSGEFWLGNKNINQLTSQNAHELRINLRDWEGQTAYAHYDAFSVGTEATKFFLTLGAFSGNAGDGMTHNEGKKFSTIDQDNDESIRDCASSREGAWWYGQCTESNLNGIYLNGSYSGEFRGVYWSYWRERTYSLQFTEMKMRSL